MKLLLQISLLLLCSSVTAQNFLRSFGSINNDEALAIGKDDDGNVYTTGYFNSNLTFGSNNIVSNGMSDIFVGKNTSSGGTQWIFSGGSSGPDRGFDIVSASNGSTVTTGYHSHNANFGGNVLPTNNFSQDFFVLKLNPGGDVDWVRGFGGEMGDTGYAVDIDPNGNILVTGQFRGTIDFDGTVFTSTPLEDGGISFDTFILKLNPDGDVLWAKHGQNAHESRGLDIKSDGLGNVLVCGQFSDTLTFDQTHNNEIFNAAFVVKFDADGNEQWFRRFTSSQTIAHALEINSSNEIYVTGDNIGPMLFYTENGSTFFPAEHIYNLFLAKFSGTGELLWLTNNGSASPVSSKDIALDADELPYITGTFNCRFDEYSEEYGSGIFYSAGWRDVFISKFSHEGEREWSRHMASNRDSYCSAITLKNSDMPIITGSYENKFVVANVSGFVAHTSNSTNNIGPIGNCGDDNYGRMRRVTSEGNKDIFLTAPIDLSREPIDMFFRPEANCEREYRPVCVNQCEDSLVHCGPTSVALDDYIYSHLSPLFNLEWTSPGGTPISDLEVPSTGTYLWTYERQDGCISFADTLHAIINPVPLPLISDDVVVNSFAPPHAEDIELCHPDTIILTGSNYGPTDSFWWSGNAGFLNTDTNSTIAVYQSGEYTFTIENEFGCSRDNELDVEVYYPIDTLEAYIGFPSYDEPVDTIFVCEGSSFTAMLYPSDSLETGLQFIINNAEVDWSVSSGFANIWQGSNHITANYTMYQSGMYNLVVEILGVCNASEIVIEREVYVVVLPEPNVSILITGENEICPGDTTILVANGHDIYNWGGPEHLPISTDSVLAWNSGLYSISASVTNEFGCTGNSFSNFYLSYREAPEVTMLPASGIVCPGDSVLLTTEDGFDHTWVGPQGQVIGTGQSIYVDIPGFYHCIVTDLDSCTLESNFVEVKEYASPYLVMLPGNDLCITGFVEISAVTDPSASVWWGPPLNTSNPNVIVSNAGVYTATVTLCGITTTQSVTIYATSVNAFISLNEPPTVCNGSSVLLTANTGMDSYLWSPGGETTPYLWVSEPGVYTLYTYDEQGCEGVSQPIEITGEPNVEWIFPPSLYVCPEDSINLSIDGSFTEYNWIPSGDSLHEIWVTEPGSYQVVVVDENGCTGVSGILQILPGEYPILPEVDDVVHCSGDDLILNIPGNNTVHWLTNEGSEIANPLTIEALAEDTLLYYLVVDENGCTSVTDSILVQIVPSTYLPEIWGDVEVCSNDTVYLFTDEMIETEYIWSINGDYWTGSNEFHFHADSSLGSTIIVVLNVEVADCTTGQSMIEVTLLPLPEALSILGNPNPCDTSATWLYTEPPDSVSAQWEWQESESFSDSIQIQPPISDSVLVSLTTFLNGCSSPAVELWVVQQPNPEFLEINTNAPLCAGELLTISGSTNDFANFSITTPLGYTVPNQLNLFPADTADSGIYHVSASSPFCSTQDTLWVQVYPVPNIDLGPDSVYCTGSVAEFEIQEYDLVFWNDSIFANSYSTTADGTVKVEVINNYGCPAKDSVLVYFEPCDGLFNNVFTPNGDGINDTFNFNPYGFEELHVIIYNRWGKVVCELVNIDHWDGIHCKTGIRVSDGTYFYVVNYATREFVQGSKKGYIQVFR